MIGQTLGNYRILRQLGEGGMGAVFEAVHEQIGRKAAIKVLHPEVAQNPNISQRFFNEARAVNIINHPSIVQIYEFDHKADGAAYIVMEYLEGESLSHRLKRLGRLGPDALRLTRQVASALAAAHAKGIVHRDMKPDNVMIVADPEAPGGERCKVLDFGIAKVHEANAGGAGGGARTATHVVMGTPTYMAPEQCMSTAAVDEKADVYALGVMLFQMVAGQLPFAGDNTVTLMYQHMQAAPPRLAQVVPGIPQELDALVDSMLAKQAAARPTMRDVIGAMERLGAQVSGMQQPLVQGAGPAQYPSQPQIQSQYPSQPQAQPQYQSQPQIAPQYPSQPQIQQYPSQPQIQQYPSQPQIPNTTLGGAVGQVQPMVGTGTNLQQQKKSGGAGLWIGLGGGVAVIGVVIAMVFVMKHTVGGDDDDVKPNPIASSAGSNNPYENPNPAPKVNNNNYGNSGKNVKYGGKANVNVPIADDDDDADGQDDIGDDAAGALSSACGRFGAMRIAAPAGFSILGCTDDGVSGSLVLSGTGDPIAACNQLKRWGTAARYTVEKQAAVAGTATFQMRRGGDALILACTRNAGQSIVSISLTPH